jgi:hypothetical protein
MFSTTCIIYKKEKISKQIYRKVQKKPTNSLSYNGFLISETSTSYASNVSKTKA